MKKGEFWIFLLFGLEFLILLSLLGPWLTLVERVLFALVAMVLILNAGRFLGYGRPQTYLPTGEKLWFWKISVEEGRDWSMFLTLGVMTGDEIYEHDSARLYEIDRRLLFDSNGRPITINEIPQKFQVKIGWQIIEEMPVKEHPKTRKVYQILPLVDMI